MAFLDGGDAGRKAAESSPEFGSPPAIGAAARGSGAAIGAAWGGCFRVCMPPLEED